MKITSIAQIAVYHYGMVYKLEVDYILDSGKLINCVHGEPKMADLVKDVISISGECTYSQLSLVNLMMTCFQTRSNSSKYMDLHLLPLFGS
jgi:hypothetical protein